MGQWWPEQADFSEGFIMWRGLGVNYEFGVLEAPARVAIHFVHRLGALTASTVILIATLGYWRRTTSAPMRGACVAVWMALAMQVSLGVATVWFGLPLAIATAHNGVAAVLLLTVVNLNNVASRAPA
jgi:cytochrome c oxidase assembly protein subunit 15